jgi:succinyl-diaminopimelate desuccinylase
LVELPTATAYEVIVAMLRQRRLEHDCLSLARELIKIQSLTPITPELTSSAALSLDCLENFLEARGARCHRLTFEGGHEKWGYPVDNLFAEWPGDDAFGHLCFIGHTDVVPPGDLSLWSFDPFCGRIQDGFLCGRGATDMKGAVAAFCTAAAAFAVSTGRPRPKVGLIVTTDEEWAAINGTRKVLDWMRVSGRNPTAFLVGEPSSPTEFGSHIKIGRRGSLSGTIQVKGVQGHAAYPTLFENPNRTLALALTVLDSHVWDDASEIMPATAFEVVALTAGSFDSTAIIPGEARALWNIRYTPQQTPVGLVAKLKNLLDDLPKWARHHPDSAKLAHIVIHGHTDIASMPYQSAPSSFARLVAGSVAANIGRIPVADAGGGTTDGRFVHAAFPQAEIVELGPPESCGGKDGTQKHGGMHQPDERCSIANLGLMTRCYTSILSGFGQTAL